MKTRNTGETDKQLYRIGAVSKLTGISPDTLRVWERRYQLVQPGRTDKGGRLYTRDDVSLLVKIKSLVDHGHAISTLVSLNDEQLHERLSQLSGVTSLAGQVDSQRVCIVGQALGIRIYYAEKPDYIDVLETFDDTESYMRADTECDSLLVELPVLDAKSVDFLDTPGLRERVKRIVVIYVFGRGSYVSQMTRRGVQVLKAPVSNEILWKVISNPLSAQSQDATAQITIDNAALETVPPRLFTPEQIAYCANVDSKLQCECPHHMSQMIETMVAFESYSEACENMTTADATLHGYLHVMTAKARHMMEEALKTLLEAESIDLTQVKPGRPDS